MSWIAYLLTGPSQTDHLHASEIHNQSVHSNWTDYNFESMVWPMNHKYSDGQLVVYLTHIRGAITNIHVNRFFASVVWSHMHLQMIWLIKILLAHFAFKWLFISVGLPILKFSDSVKLFLHTLHSYSFAPGCIRMMCAFKYLEWEKVFLNTWHSWGFCSLSKRMWGFKL